MRFGICTGISALDDAAAADFDFVELPVRELAPEDGAAFEKVKAQILAAPIPVEACNCFVPGSLRLTGPDVDLPAVTAYMEIALQRAATVGAKIMVFGSGAARRAPEGYPVAQAREEFLRIAIRAADMAAPLGITVVIEPLSRRLCNHTTLVSQGAALVKAAEQSNLRLLADSYHMQAAEEPFSELVAAGPYLYHIHVDTPALAGLRGGAIYDQSTLFTALRRAGYSGAMSVEDHSSMFNQEQPFSLAEVYRRVREALVTAIGL